jgi:hypothetical protein
MNGEQLLIESNSIEWDEKEQGWRTESTIFVDPFKQFNILESPTSKLSVLDFRSRFTNEEKVAIYTAATTNLLIKIWLDDLSAASIVDLTDIRTIEGVEALETAGILTVGRSLEILTP